jgi:hypothetical protein
MAEQDNNQPNTELDKIAKELGLNPNPMSWFPGENEKAPSQQAQTWLRSFGAPYKNAQGDWVNLTPEYIKRARNSKEKPNENLMWSKVPELKDYLKYDEPEGGKVRSLTEYIAALEAFKKGPQRKDFKTEKEFESAEKAFVESFTKPENFLLGSRVPNVNIDYISGGIKNVKQTRDANINKWLTDEINKAKKDLNKRLEEPLGQTEQQNYLVVTKQTEEDLAAAETERVTAEARQDALGNVAIPGFKTQDVFTGTADRPRTEKRKTDALLTRDEWVEQWATMTPKEKEQFKAQIAGALGDSAQGAAIRSLDINDAPLQQTWLSYGLYLSESYRKDKTTPRAMTRESFSRYISESGSFDASEGDRTAIEQDIINFYRNNGLPILENFIANAVNKISRGDLDLETWKQTQRKLLAKEYPDFADEFAAGFDLRDLSTNYISKMAQVLELDPDTIDLNNSLLKSGLQGRATPDGKLASKTLREFELDLRKDPRWKQTQAAQQEASSAASFILEKFGFRS